MIKVIKKDGTKEEFNVQKVIVAVNKSAYRALVKFTDEEIDFIYLSAVGFGQHGIVDILQAEFDLVGFVSRHSYTSIS